jgi:hypothetical protein
MFMTSDEGRNKVLHFNFTRYIKKKSSCTNLKSLQGNFCFHLQASRSDSEGGRSVENLTIYETAELTIQNLDQG